MSLPTSSSSSAAPDPGAVHPTLPAPSVTSGAPAARTDAVRFVTTVLCWGLLALGVIWRLVDLNYPPDFSFDEHHFVRNARNYIQGQADWNDHPPLGKLLLVPGMLAFGDHGFGWRISSALLGLALVALAGLNAAKIFGDRRAGLFAAAFVAIDGFFISYARTALLDTPLTLFMFAALALMLWGRSLAWFAGAAVCVGLAVATKWTGVCVILLAPWLLWRARRSPLHTAWMFAIASLVYMAVSVIALSITHQPISLGGMMGTNLQLLQHHAGFTVWDNAASSKWYSWPFLWHPFILHYAEVAPGQVRATSTVGNPLLWYAATAALLAALAALPRALAAFRRARAPLRSLDRPAPFVVAAMAALTLPFILTHRQSYIFHYLGAYGLCLGLLGGALARLEQRAPRAVLGFLGAAAAVSIWYAPIWTYALISRAGFLMRLPFPGWR
jgi:dolichyl-phosphate-mannose--protein O-mannosyl transferase